MQQRSQAAKKANSIDGKYAVAAGRSGGFYQIASVMHDADDRYRWWCMRNSLLRSNNMKHTTQHMNTMGLMGCIKML